MGYSLPGRGGMGYFFYLEEKGWDILDVEEGGWGILYLKSGNGVFFTLKVVGGRYIL